MSVAGVEVSLCSKVDPDCSRPDVATAITDESGNAMFSFQPGASDMMTGFDGYLRARKDAPDAALDDRWVATYYYFNPNVRADVHVIIHMTTVGLRRVLSQQAGQEQRDDRGIIVVDALDCDARLAEGVTFELDDSGGADSGADDTPFTVVKGLPTIPVQPTDSEGNGGFVNVRPGFRVVTGKIAATGQIFDTTSMAIRANTITFAQVAAGSDWKTRRKP